MQLLLFHFLLPSPSQPFIPNPLCQFDPSKLGGSRLIAWQTQGWYLLREREALGTGRTHTPPPTATYPLLSAASSPTIPVGLTGPVCLSGIICLKLCPVLFCLMLMSIAL